MKPTIPLVGGPRAFPGPHSRTQPRMWKLLPPDSIGYVVLRTLSVDARSSERRTRSRHSPETRESWGPPAGTLLLEREAAKARVWPVVELTQHELQSSWHAGSGAEPRHHSGTGLQSVSTSAVLLYQRRRRHFSELLSISPIARPVPPAPFHEHGTVRKEGSPMSQEDFFL